MTAGDYGSLVRIRGALASAFAVAIAIALASGCSSSSSGSKTPGSGGESQGTGGAAGGTSSGGSGGGANTCYSGADHATYNDGDVGCKDVYNTAICDKGVWTSTHFCDGSNCYCDYGSCTGSDCI
jgi:hypothetical protein